MREGSWETRVEFGPGEKETLSGWRADESSRRMEESWRGLFLLFAVERSFPLCLVGCKDEGCALVIPPCRYVALSLRACVSLGLYDICYLLQLMQVSISALLSTLGIGFSLGLICVDLIHDIGAHAPSYYPTMLSPSPVLPFMLLMAGVFAVAAFRRVFQETSKSRSLLRVLMLLASGALLVDVIGSEANLVQVSIGTLEAPVGLARRILVDHLLLAAIMVGLLFVEISSIRGNKQEIKVDTKVKVK